MSLRHVSVPYTPAELAEIKAKFEKLPTFDGKSFTSADFKTGILHVMKMDRSNDQIQAYVDYFDRRHNGRCTLDHAVDFASKYCSPKAFGRKLAELVDENKNGFIDAEEFKDIVDLVSVHIGRKSSVTYDRFLKEADKDGSNTVDINEAANWIEQYLGKHTLAD